MRSPWRGSAVLASAALVLAAGCSSGSDSEAGSKVKEVRIGVLEPISGTNASTGTDATFGAELAAEIINGAHPEIGLPLAKEAGLPNLGGAKIKLVKADSKGLPETGGTETERLVTDEKVVAVTGAYQSAVTKTASEKAERLKVPFVNGDSSSTALNQRGLDYFFHVGPSDLIFGQTFFSLLKDQIAAGKQVKTIAIIHTDDAFGNDGATVTHQLADDNNLTVVKDVKYATAATDVSGQVQQVRAANPDVVFVLSFVKDSILLAGTFKQLGYTPPVVMGYGAGFSDPKMVDGPELAANATGFFRRTSWSKEIAERNPTAQKVAALFKQKYGQEMTENSAREFTAVMTVAQAINEGKSVDPAKIRAALQNINIPGRDLIAPWDGIKFDDNHQNTGARGVVEQFLKGKWTVVYPSDVKSTAAVWPGTNASQG